MKNTITKNDLKEFLTNGGATLNERAEAVNFANGFQVSKKDFYILPVSNVGAILAAVNALLNTAKKGEFVGLTLFVGIPLPGTGAWTGALVASLFDMPRKKTVISICAGVITAGIIMTVGSQLVLAVVNLFS